MSDTKTIAIATIDSLQTAQEFLIKSLLKLPEAPLPITLLGPAFTFSLAFLEARTEGRSAGEESKQPVNPSGKIGYDFRNSRVAEYNRAYAALADELGIPYLDLFTALSGERRWQAASGAGDGVHPPSDGYALVAEKVGAWPAWRDWLD